MFVENKCYLVICIYFLFLYCLIESGIVVRLGVRRHKNLFILAYVLWEIGVLYLER